MRRPIQIFLIQPHGSQSFYDYRPMIFLFVLWYKFKQYKRPEYFQHTQYNMTLYIYQSRSWNESTLWIEQDIVKEGCLETPDTLHPITPLMASQCWLTLGNCFRDVSGVVYDFVYLFSYQTCLHLAFETSAHLVLVGNHVRLHSLFFFLEYLLEFWSFSDFFFLIFTIECSFLLPAFFVLRSSQSEYIQIVICQWSYLVVTI